MNNQHFNDIWKLLIEMRLYKKGASVWLSCDNPSTKQIGWQHGYTRDRFTIDLQDVITSLPLGDEESVLMLTKHLSKAPERGKIAELLRILPYIQRYLNLMSFS